MSELSIYLCIIHVYTEIYAHKYVYVIQAITLLVCCNKLFSWWDSPKFLPLICLLFVKHFFYFHHLIFFFFSFFNLFFILLYNTALVLPYIDMNLPWVYMSSQTWTAPTSPYHLSGSYQYTSPKHPVSCIKPRLAIMFLTW